MLLSVFVYLTLPVIAVVLQPYYICTVQLSGVDAVRGEMRRVYYRHIPYFRALIYTQLCDDPVWLAFCVFSVQGLFSVEFYLAYSICWSKQLRISTVIYMCTSKFLRPMAWLSQALFYLSFVCSRVDYLV